VSAVLRSDEWFTDEIAASLNLDRTEIKAVTIHVRTGSLLQVDVEKFVRKDTQSEEVQP